MLNLLNINYYCVN